MLINNAGVDYDIDQTVGSADLARVRRLFETNLFGAWTMAQAVAPGMRRRPWGRIVNVSSGAGSLGTWGAGRAFDLGGFNPRHVFVAHAVGDAFRLDRDRSDRKT